MERSSLLVPEGPKRRKQRILTAELDPHAGARQCVSCREGLSIIGKFILKVSQFVVAIAPANATSHGESMVNEQRDASVIRLSPWLASSSTREHVPSSPNILVVSSARPCIQSVHSQAKAVPFAAKAPGSNLFVAEQLMKLLRRGDADSAPAHAS